MNIVYMITTTDGFRTRVVCPEHIDPTDHPSLTNRVLDVETLGEDVLSLV